MSSVHAVPLLLGLLVGLLLGLVTWGLLRAVASEASDNITGSGDGLVLALLALAAFSLGAFLTYLLLSFRH